MLIYIYFNFASYNKCIAENVMESQKIIMHKYFFNQSFLETIYQFIEIESCFKFGVYVKCFCRNAYHGASPYLMGLTALSTWRFNVPTGFGIHQVCI